MALPSQWLKSGSGSAAAGNGADRGEHAQVSHRPLVVDATEPLEVDALAVRVQPIDHLVEQARVVAAESCGGQQEGFGIDDAVVLVPALPSDSKCGPLVPQEIKEAPEEPILGMLE